MQEESVLISVALSEALIACRFQTSHLGCNYVEELKTDFCHSSGIVTLHHVRRWHAVVGVAVDAKGQSLVALFIREVLKQSDREAHVWMHDFAHDLSS